MKGQNSAMQFSRVKHAPLSFCLPYLMYCIPFMCADQKACSSYKVFVTFQKTWIKSLYLFWLLLCLYVLFEAWIFWLHGIFFGVNYSFTMLQLIIDHKRERKEIRLLCHPPAQPPDVSGKSKNICLSKVNEWLQIIIIRY